MSCRSLRDCQTVQMSSLLPKDLLQLQPRMLDDVLSNVVDKSGRGAQNHARNKHMAHGHGSEPRIL